MFDTYLTITGNVLNLPEWRRTLTGALVVSFKVASTARRLNRETGQWEDGNSLRVRVTCWRRLAEGVGSSVLRGDPVVVVGRLYSRDWVDDAGTKRVSYELDAVAVGHDLSRGRAKFARFKPVAGTSMVEDPGAEARVAGEHTNALPADEVPVPPPGELDDLEGDGELARDAWGGGSFDPVRLDDDPFGEAAPVRPGAPDDPGPGEPDQPFGPGVPDRDEDEPAEEEPGRRRRRRTPVPA